MNKDVFTYLRSYSFDPTKINRLVVSAFLYSFDITTTKNTLLKDLLIKNNEAEYKSLQEFLKIHRFSNLEELIKVFEFVISPEDKVVTGAVYTPKNIREYILNQCFSKVAEYNTLKICDPACGCSGFLYTAAKEIKQNTNLTYSIIFKKAIYGLDIEDFAVQRSKILLTLLALTEGEDNASFEFNIFQGNALNFSWDNIIHNFKGFDIVVGNPPYVCSRNIDSESKQYIFNWKVSSSGHPDLYIPFFQIGVENLKPDGILGYITMNSFFKSINGRALRQYFEDESLDLQILDFGGNQIFQSKSTYTCICIIQKRLSNKIKYAKGEEHSIQNGVKFKPILYTSLNHKNGWNLHNVELLNQIEKKGTPFGELYRTRNGIATLKNNIYIFNPVREDNDFYYLQNGDTFPVEKGICKEIINPNKLTRINDIDQLRKKVIFPYEYNQRGDAILIDEEKFENLYPQAYAYLKNKRGILATRDKGKGKYENWYAYGRNQSLERYSSKLFFPHITPHIPNFTISTDKNLLFYNGLAVVSDDVFELQFLQKLMGSGLFWFYITNSSRPYGSGFFSLSRNYIKNFGVCDFTRQEKVIMIEGDAKTIDELLEDKYEIRLNK